MNVRSVRFRLVSWYASVLVVLCAGFGVYTYLSLRHYLTSALEDSLRRRAHQIGTSLLLGVSRTGEAFVAEQLRSFYAPELNNRFIRVSRPDGSVLYVSGTPVDMSFEPARVPTVRLRPGEERVTSLPGEHLLLLSVPFAVGGRVFMVEVGSSTLESEALLRGFALTLGLGLSVLLVLGIGGGALLIEQAFAPVHRVTEAAREITSRNLRQRLPVPRTADEVAHLTLAMNEMIGRLDEALQHARRFTADASHELRTPLTVMRGELESAVRDASLKPGVRARVGSVLEETERLARIVEDLLAMSRLEAGEALLERTRFDLARLVASTAEQMALLAEDKAIEVRCLGDAAVEVEGDQSRLRQVVVNLLDNAVKFTPEGGRVWLETHDLGGRAVLEVTDTGPGIPEAALPRVFERFFRADGMRTGHADGGSGLGLAIVRLIITAHGGTVSAHNDPSGGCRVTVSLPLAPASAAAGAREGLSRRDSPVGTP
ncbi:MAG TPA: ATP-binding protein [Vicinamibacteria bacterium]|nr:ATP-binding protein [Vicinamibacteria bacterium]